MIDRFLGAAAEAAFLDSVGMRPAYRFQLAELLTSLCVAWPSWCGAMQIAGWAARMPQ